MGTILSMHFLLFVSPVMACCTPPYDTKTMYVFLWSSVSFYHIRKPGQTIF